MTTCDECGVGSRGALIVEVGDRYLCVDCRAPGECRRCGRETEETTLAGEFQCEDRSDRKRDQDDTRDASQQGLGGWLG